MYETITGLGLLAGIVTMLLALYHTKSDRTRAKKFLFASILFYVVATIAIFADTESRDLIAHFQDGGKLMCRDYTVSLEDGWRVKGDDYLIKDEQIFYVKMCREL